MRRLVAVTIVGVLVFAACSDAMDAIASAETCAELDMAMNQAMEDMSDPTDIEAQNEILALALERRQELETRAMNDNDTAEMESCQTMDFGSMTGGP